MSIFPTKVLLATDGSKEADLAATTAADLAGKTKTLSENRQIEQNVGAGQLNQCQPVFGLLRPASAQAASLDEPRDRPLHHPSPRRVNPL